MPKLTYRMEDRLKRRLDAVCKAKHWTQQAALDMAVRRFVEVEERLLDQEWQLRYYAEGAQ